MGNNKQSTTTRKSHHVVPAPKGGWNVKKAGSQRASKHFPTKQEAIHHGRRVSSKQRTDLFIHRRDGTVERKASSSGGKE